MYKKIYQYLSGLFYACVFLSMSVAIGHAVDVAADKTSYENTIVCSSLFLTASVIDEENGDVEGAKTYQDIGSILLQGAFMLSPEKEKQEVEAEIKTTMLTMLSLHEKNPTDFQLMVLEYGSECVKLAEKFLQ